MTPSDDPQKASAWIDGQTSLSDEQKVSLKKQLDDKISDDPIKKQTEDAISDEPVK